MAAPGDSLVVPGGTHATQALPYPLLDVTLRPFPVVQGHTLELEVETAAPMTVTGVLSGTALHFEADPASNTRYYALQGIYRLLDPNLYPLELSAVGADGQSVSLSQRLPVHAGDYLVDDPLTVDPATIDPATTIPEQNEVFSITAPVTSQRLWDGLFVLPSVGSFRSVFGSLRSYNGGPYNSFHGGVDFSGAEDRPITAPAPGVVVFTGKLIVRGKDRAEAVSRMSRALEMFIIEGIFTTIPLHRRILADPDFRAGNIDTTFIERFLTQGKNQKVS
jgi:hypothetical protein